MASPCATAGIVIVSRPLPNGWLAVAADVMGDTVDHLGTNPWRSSLRRLSWCASATS